VTIKIAEIIWVSTLGNNQHHNHDHPHMNFDLWLAITLSWLKTLSCQCRIWARFIAQNSYSSLTLLKPIGKLHYTNSPLHDLNSLLGHAQVILCYTQSYECGEEKFTGFSSIISFKKIRI